MKVLVCGSRSWNRPTLIGRRLAQLPFDSEIIEGGASGVDYYAAIYARVLGMSVREYPADWKRYGRKAGPIRNRQMLDEVPDLVLAFWDGESPGTRDTIREAKRRGLPVEVAERAA